MKKRIIIITVILAILLSITLIIAVFSDGFQKSILTGKIYYPQNVYEEIWNLVLIEKNTRNQTVLTSATKDAYVDFDFGIEFVGVRIPECNVTISLDRTVGNEELFFRFFSDNGNCWTFAYSYETKTLYGNTAFPSRMESFLTDYFKWCENDTDFTSGFSSDELGDYTYKCVNSIYDR